jgi:superfamily II DNA or RNA helicase
MISEGVDIPRLRVGVFASNVVSELYFRQFCGRFVRTGSGPQREREAYVYLPDDIRLRAMAGRITDDVRHALAAEREIDDVASALAAANRAERASDEGEYASIAATAREASVLNFGPLFNPGAFLAGPAPHDTSEPDAPIESEPEHVETHADKRDTLRRELRSLVARASTAFAVDHKLVHATLNQRFGGPVATATIAGLESRRRLVELWLERRNYDGMRSF